MRTKLTAFSLILTLSIVVFLIRKSRHDTSSVKIDNSTVMLPSSQASTADLQHNRIVEQKHKSEHDLTDRSSNIIAEVVDRLQLLELDRIKFTKQTDNPEKTVYTFTMAQPNSEEALQVAHEIKKTNNLYGIRDFDETIQPWSNMLSEEYVFPNHFKELRIQVTQYKENGDVNYTVTGCRDTSGESDPGSFAILTTRYVDDITKQWRFKHIIDMAPTNN